MKVMAVITFPLHLVFFVTSLYFLLDIELRNLQMYGSKTWINGKSIPWLRDPGKPICLCYVTIERYHLPHLIKLGH